MRARSAADARVEIVVLAVIAWTIATVNGAWWGAVGAGRAWADPANWLFMLAAFVALVALHFALLARWRIAGPSAVAHRVVIASAATVYFMRNYAVMLDPTMIQNILETDTREARELLSWSIVGSVLLWSALPLAFIWCVRIEHRPWMRAFAARTACMAGAIVVAVLAVLLGSRSHVPDAQSTRAALSHHAGQPDLRARGAAGEGARDTSMVRAPLGTDARLLRVGMAAPKPRVFVLVVGETARAANFSLLGYPRVTTPELARMDIAAFRNVRSCGTSTEVSVPCMFSPFGRADYDETRIRNTEGLLNVLARAGYSVEWIDNQSGCKGVCKGEGIEYRKIDPKRDPDLCSRDECLDGILVRALAAELANVTRDTVIVLHMMGNHGPAYFKRYPPAFRRFTPDCGTAELRKCTRNEVVNAYDNAILYTDHVIASLVDALANRSASLDTALLYVSDHGESLGEAGMYLHGLPYSIAPDTQKQVPMIAWVSPQFRPRMRWTGPVCGARSTSRCRTTTCSIPCSECWTCRPAFTSPSATSSKDAAAAAGPAFAQNGRER